MQPKWNPQQYNRFKAERAKPFFDLMNLVEKDPPIVHAVDLGCGTGELTAELQSSLNTQNLIGIDNSAEMLSEAQRFVQPGLNFENRSIDEFEPSEKQDLIFSNAALQWLPDHQVLFPKILSWVAPAQGQFACQMPYNFDHPSHQIAADIAKTLFPQSHSQPTRSLLALERYAEILHAEGFKRQTCRIEIYAHEMASGRDVIEWTKGTLLNGYRATLSPQDFEAFLSQYTREIIRMIGEGPYYYTFKRLLVWGRR